MNIYLVVVLGAVAVVAIENKRAAFHQSIKNLGDEIRDRKNLEYSYTLPHSHVASFRSLERRISSYPHNGPRTTNPLLGRYGTDRRSFLAPNAVKMEPMIPYSQKDPLFDASGDHLEDGLAGNELHAQSKILTLPENHYEPLFASRGEHLPPSGPPYGPVILPYYEHPEPIIEIIIKESNESLPAAPILAPTSTKHKKEPVQVFYVKYQKDPHGGENDVIYDKPIPAITPPTNSEEDHHEHYTTASPEVLTLAPPPSTTLRAIIRPESEHYHSDSGIKITFGGSEGSSHNSHGDSYGSEGHEESAPHVAVAFPQAAALTQKQTVPAQSHFQKRQQVAPRENQAFQSQNFQQNVNHKPQSQPPVAQQRIQSQPPSFPQNYQQQLPLQNSPNQQFRPVQNQNQFPRLPNAPLFNGPPQGPHPVQIPHSAPQSSVQNLPPPHVGPSHGGPPQGPFTQFRPTPNFQQRPAPIGPTSPRGPFKQGPQRPFHQGPQPQQFQFNEHEYLQQNYHTITTDQLDSNGQQLPSKPHQNFREPPRSPIQAPFPISQEEYNKRYNEQVQHFKQQDEQRLRQRIPTGPQNTKFSQSFDQQKHQQFSIPQNHQPEQQKHQQFQIPKNHPSEQQKHQQFQIPQNHPSEQQKHQQFQTIQSHPPEQQKHQQFQIPQSHPPEPQKHQQFQIPQNHQPSFNGPNPNFNQQNFNLQHNNRPQNAPKPVSQFQQGPGPTQVPHDIPGSHFIPPGGELIASVPKYEQHLLITPAPIVRQNAQHSQPLPQASPLVQHFSQNGLPLEQQKYQQTQFGDKNNPSSIGPDFLTVFEQNQREILELQEKLRKSEEEQQKLIALTSSTISSSTSKSVNYNQQQYIIPPNHQTSYKSNEQYIQIQGRAPQSKPYVAHNTNKPPLISSTSYYNSIESSTTPRYSPSIAKSTGGKIEAKEKVTTKRPIEFDLPDEVPDDLRQQLLSSGILENAQISVLDYDKVGDIPLESLPPEQLANFYGAGGKLQISESAPVASVINRSGARVQSQIQNDQYDQEDASSEHDYVNTYSKKRDVEMKVVHFDPNTAKGQQVAEKYVQNGAKQVDPVALNDHKYNRYLPLKVSGSHFPLPDVPELAGRKVTSVVVLAPVNTDLLNGDKDSGRSERAAPSKNKSINFVAGDALKRLVKTPSLDNYKKWLEIENNTTPDLQSVVLLVTGTKTGNGDKEIFMYDVATQTVSKLSGELSTAFVDVAETNANSKDFDQIAVADSGTVESSVKVLETKITAPKTTPKETKHSNHKTTYSEIDAKKPISNEKINTNKRVPDYGTKVSSDSPVPKYSESKKSVDTSTNDNDGQKPSNQVLISSGYSRMKMGRSLEADY